MSGEDHLEGLPVLQDEIEKMSSKDRLPEFNRERASFLVLDRIVVIYPDRNVHHQPNPFSRVTGFSERLRQPGHLLPTRIFRFRSAGILIQIGKEYAVHNNDAVPEKRRDSHAIVPTMREIGREPAFTAGPAN